MAKRTMWQAISAATLALTLAACATTPPRTPYSEQDSRVAAVPGLPGAREWGDVDINRLSGTSRLPHPQPGQPYTYLALSGGGGEGAYGAGLLNGWSASGTRPVFTLVSGVSTGALIAPFAFLGRDEDATLKELYTSGIAETFVSSPGPLRAIFGSGIFSSEPLREAVARYVDQPFLDKIAAEDAKGRRLIIVTTDLDAQRPVVWDMGLIAAWRSPRALGLFRDVVIASASVPVVFPPVLIDAEANGHTFKELHVDGTTTTPIFILPQQYLLRPELQLTRALRPELYLVVNNRIDPTFEVVPDRTEQVAVRSFSTLNKQNTRSTIAAVAQAAKSNHLAFNLAFIDKSIPETSVTGFDTPYMRTLYQDGYDKARRGAFWLHELPVTSSAPAIPANPQRQGARPVVNDGVLPLPGAGL